VQLVLTEDQEFIAKTAEDFVAEKSPISRVRELRDSADATGFSRELWKEMADLGWAGILFSVLVLESMWFTVIFLFVLWAGTTELRLVRVREYWRRAGRFADESGTVIDAEVVSPGEDGSQLKDFERQFLDMIKRHGRGGKDS